MAKGHILHIFLKFKHLLYTNPNCVAKEATKLIQVTCISWHVFHRIAIEQARLIPGMCFHWQGLQILDLLDQEQEEETPLQDTAFQRSSLPRNTEIYQTHKHYGIILQNSIYHIILSPSIVNNWDNMHIPLEIDRMDLGMLFRFSF